MRIIEKQLSEIETTVSDFLRVNCSVQWGVIYAGSYKELNGQAWEHDKWSFTFTRTDVKKSINFDYHTGVGHRIKSKLSKEYSAVKPGPAGIIYSVIMGGNACHQSFADWCAALGYDTDSRKALAMYEACQQEYNKLQSMLQHTEIEQLHIILEKY